VLGGIITGLAAQGLPPFDAAVLGAYLHGAAAELARAEWGDAGLLSGELAVYVPEVRQRLLGDL
jgi:NAD(P)H-hydrate epimerase